MATVQQENSIIYNDNQYELLQKAGLVGKGVITIYAKTSKDKRPYSTDGRHWEIGGKMGRHTTDRRSVVDIAVPTCDSRYRIYGYWKNNVTDAEFNRLVEEMGIPTFTVGRTILKEKGENIIIRDTEIQLYHEKTYDLSDPMQMAEWLIVKHSSLIAPEVRDNEGNLITTSEDNVFSNDWYSFYFENAEAKVDIEAKKVTKELNFVIDKAKLDKEVKVQVAKIMHYRGYNPVDNFDNLPDSIMVHVFDACLTNKDMHEKLDECIAIKDKLMHLNLHRLVQVGRVMKYGVMGPYHLEITAAGQERGELLGNTDNEAVRALSHPTFQHLLNHLNRTVVNIIQTGPTNESLESMKIAQFKVVGEMIEKNELRSYSVQALQAFLTMAGETPNGNNQLALQKQVKDVHAAWKKDYKPKKVE